MKVIQGTLTSTALWIPGRGQEPVTSEQHRIQCPVLLQSYDQPVEPAQFPQCPQKQGGGRGGGWQHLRCGGFPWLHHHNTVEK